MEKDLESVRKEYKELSSKFQTLISNSPNDIAIVDQNYDLVFLNRIVAPFKVKDFLGRSLLSFFSDEHAQKLKDAIDTIFADNKPIVLDGIKTDKYILLTHLSPISIADVVEQVMIIFIDITEFKETQNLLVQSEERYRSFVESSPNTVHIWDNNGVVKYVNRIPEGIDDTIIGQSAYNLIDEADVEIVRSSVSKAFSERKVVKAEFTSILANRYLTQFVPLSGTELLVIGVNINEIRAKEQELKETREQLFHAQKMEAIGRITGGIAHDFNNLLTIISLNSEMLLVEAQNQELPDSINEMVRNVMEATKTASNLTRQLLTYSRKEKFEMSKENINQILGNCISKFSILVDKNIQIIKGFEEDAGNVLIDRTKFEQVVMNLITNAGYAMRDLRTNKILRIETHLHPSNTISLQGEPNEKEMVEIAIQDNGIGMDRDTLEKIFEPYFTTKHSGEGTGLGMAIVYAIVKQSNGDILIESELGKGTKVMIFLPRFT